MDDKRAIAAKRAQDRAAEKASRAAALGIKLPSRKSIRPRGWAGLRERLKQGTLLKMLKDIEAASLPHTGRGRKPSASRRSSLHQLKSHLADIAIAYQVKAGDITGADSKLLAEHTKVAQELQKRKRQERQFRRKLIKKQQKLERELEYLNFPTIMGWYFDGFFSPYFQLNEEYATIFNQKEREISKQKENSIKETFAEKAKRYFWPPKVFGNFCFRTRGIYLDFKEIMKDPPHTPPEIILDQRAEAVTLFDATDHPAEESQVPSEEELGGDVASLAALQAEEERLQKMLKAIDDDPFLTDEEKANKKRALLFAFHKKKQRTLLQQQVADEMHFKATNKKDFYFDDQAPGFFRKKGKDRGKYYYDSKWDVWRIKRTIIHFPNDFYWDEQLAIFFPKDRTRPPDYYLLDPELGVYRVAGEPVPPNWRGIKPSHFFFDHKIGKWVKKTKASAGQIPNFDKNGTRYCLNKNVDTPDDYYFDPGTAQFEKKKPAGEKYFWDGHLSVWRQLDVPFPPKLAQRPYEFYWNEQQYAFIKKDAPSSFFVWDGNNKFFRKKKSLHGKFHPKNWVWIEKNKRWELRKSSTRHNLISQSLYWNPDRDYDKPWLEYVGGYRDYHIEYDYDVEDDEGIKIVGPGGRVIGKGETKKDLGSAATGRKANEPPPKVGPGAAAAAGGSGGGGGGGKKLQFSTSEPTLKSQAGVGGSGGPSSSRKPEAGMAEEGTSRGIIKTAGSPEDHDNAELDTYDYYVDHLDRKTLKVTNLGSAVNDTDLRKYFASVKKIVRPKVPGTEFDEDYAYLKFKTDEAAQAALKTMHDQIIRGLPIHLEYKHKGEDENEGGQRDTEPQPSTTSIQK